MSTRPELDSGILKTAEENYQELSQVREEHHQVAELTRSSFTSSPFNVECAFTRLLSCLTFLFVAHVAGERDFEVHLGEATYTRKFLEISSWLQLPCPMRAVIMATSAIFWCSSFVLVVDFLVSQKMCFRRFSITDRAWLIAFLRFRRHEKCQVSRTVSRYLSPMPVEKSAWCLMSWQTSEIKPPSCFKGVRWAFAVRFRYQIVFGAPQERRLGERCFEHRDSSLWNDRADLQSCYSDFLMSRPYSEVACLLHIFAGAWSALKRAGGMQIAAHLEQLFPIELNLWHDLARDCFIA